MSFTIDPITQDKNGVFRTTIRGLGSGIEEVEIMSKTELDYQNKHEGDSIIADKDADKVEK